MKRKQAVLLCALFLAFLWGFLLLSLLTPSRSFSPMENRTLAQRPEFSLSSFFSGQWARDSEAYLTDQFPLRDTWVGLKYICERAMLRQENNGVYFAGNRLIARFDPPEESRVESNFAAVDQLAQNTNLPVRLLLAPTSAYVYRDLLPKNAPSYDQQALFNRAEELKTAQNIPIAQLLLENREESIYYRTDHHWTTWGAYLAYAAYMEAAGRQEEIISPQQLEQYQKQATDFYGTLHSQSGARFYQPDTIVYYDFPGLTMEEPGEAPKPIYDLSFVDQKDKYSLFFGGNPPQFCIRNQDPQTHGTLLVVKDSFANSLLPYLALSYREIYVFDPRYNRDSLRQFAADCGADEILVLYQTANFAQDANIGLLAL